MLPEIHEFQRWLRRKAPHTSTHVHYPSDVHLFFTWAGKPPEKVTLIDIDRYIDHARDRGHALTTVNRRLASMRAFYHFLALMADDAPANPVHPKRHFLRRAEPLPRDIPDDDLVRLFAALDHARDRAMFLLMLRCGLRVGEVRTLSLTDLTLSPHPASLPRMRLTGKGGKERVVFLSAQPLSALEKWLEIRPKNSSSQAVFLNKFGKRLSVTGIQDRLAKYCRKAGLWVTCHQFRHTFGRHLTEARVPVTTIQKLLGHSRLRTTELYLHLADPYVQADYEAAMATIAAQLASEGEAS